jgi:hypothetical protein
MTVCIAALSDGDKSYTAVSDQMITLEGSGIVISSDSIDFKQGGIHQKWIAFYSGSSSLAVRILNEARETFRREPEKQISLREISEGFKDIYKRYLTEHVSDRILSPLGWERDEFYRVGLTSLGESGFLQVRADFEYAMKNDPLLDFLVVGQASDGKMHLFSISNPGVLHYHDRQSFWAIGIGQSLALASLMFHGHRNLFDTASSIYHVLEAKFMAERAPGVGKSTVAVNVDFRTQYPFHAIFPDRVEEIRKIWEEKGKPRYPKEAKEKIREWVPEVTEK